MIAMRRWSRSTRPVRAPTVLNAASLQEVYMAQEGPSQRENRLFYSAMAAAVISVLSIWWNDWLWIPGSLIRGIALVAITILAIAYFRAHKQRAGRS